MSTRTFRGKLDDPDFRKFYNAMRLDWKGAGLFTLFDAVMMAPQFKDDESLKPDGVLAQIVEEQNSLMHGMSEHIWALNAHVKELDRQLEEYRNRVRYVLESMPPQWKRKHMERVFLDAEARQQKDGVGAARGRGAV